MYTGGDKDGQAFLDGWSATDAKDRQAAGAKVDGMNQTVQSKSPITVTIASEVDWDKLSNDLWAFNSYVKSNATSRIVVHGEVVYDNPQARGEEGPLYVKRANGGVTGYANGGYQISKHADGAVGVFTHRTRLWDPVTGVNEYGEKGHEALLPLKQSVYNEIAKGIVRQLSPAKLSGVITAMRESVRSESANTSAAVVGTADYYRIPYSTSSNAAPSTASNDTFNFYEPVPTPQAHARALKRAKRELAYD
jgi:hypothetical protein